MTMWVFGYGSLVWNPGFEPVEKVIATLPGYARSFCMRSIHHRGTEEAPDARGQVEGPLGRSQDIPPNLRDTK